MKGGELLCAVQQVLAEAAEVSKLSGRVWWAKHRRQNEF